ncbi:MAG: flagellar hook capping protein [Chlorobi bacterium]|nr:flagellar hook capping protein [Chlorobiota bacterium]
MVDNITNLLNQNGGYSPSAGKSQLGKDDFLKLMIAQMKYQDPLEPMDSTQYTAQLAQFSSLEQLTNMNDKLETSIGTNLQLTQAVNNTMTAALIGKRARIDSANISYNGQDDFTIGYNLPSTASSVEIQIYDENGALVRTMDDVPRGSGEHNVKWDYTDDDGNTVDYGDYTFKVTATTSNGEDMTFDFYGFGKIEAVRFTSDGTKLVINGVEYFLSDIVEILDSAESGSDVSSANMKDISEI